jgi:hypothetical protein
MLILMLWRYTGGIQGGGPSTETIQLDDNSPAVAESVTGPDWEEASCELEREGNFGLRFECSEWLGPT